MSQHEIEMRSVRSGRLAEAFCLKTFGIEEDEKYEIKASSKNSGRALVRCVQLIPSARKQFVIVVHSRTMKKISRGPRKGRWVHNESIEKGFKHRLLVYVMRGFQLLTIIRDERLPLSMTNVRRDAEWAFYWAVPQRCFPTNILEENDRYILFGNPHDPPGWMNEEYEEGEEEVPF